MKQLTNIVIAIGIQFLAINIQYLSAQSLNDDRGSGNCLNFDGTNDFVGGIGNTSSYAFMHNTGVFTLEAWVQLDDPDQTATWSSIIGNNATTTRTGFYLGYLNVAGYDHQLRLALQRGVTGSSVIASNSPVQVITDSEWHHVAAVGNGVNITFYVDGVAFAGTGGPMVNFPGTNSTHDLDIGAIQNVLVPGGRYSYFDGEIDEVRIWNISRTQAQIRDNMCTKLVGNETGLVGYWNMNEGDGGTVNDLTTNNNDGTLN